MLNCHLQPERSRYATLHEDMVKPGTKPSEQPKRNGMKTQRHIKQNGTTGTTEMERKHRNNENRTGIFFLRFE